MTTQIVPQDGRPALLHDAALIPFQRETMARAKVLGRDKCRNCGASLTHRPVLGYLHDGGWIVPGIPGRYWLYISCSKCHYEWALWKLGLGRDWQPGPDGESNPASMREEETCQL
jgi:hypothetical protein